MTVSKFTKSVSDKAVQDKINEIIDNLGGTSTDVQVNGTSITSNGVANLVTNTAYNSSSNKIATMSDIPASEVFVAIYNVTTFNDVATAFNSGKTIYCKYNLSSDVDTFYTLNYVYYNNNQLDSISFQRMDGNKSKTISVSNGFGWVVDIDAEFQNTVSRVTSISSSSTDKQYPSAKCVYDELANKVDTSSLSTVATSGSYTDLSNKPTIPTVPTNVSAFTNDAGYVTTDHTYPFNGITFYSTDGTTSSITRDCNQILNNGLFYYTSNGPSGLGEQSTDGALYVQAYSTSWVVQIAQDYRTGNLFTRSKNNGTWTPWKAVGGSAITIDYSGV